ncbi:MAG: AMP-binding enzyme, partial [Actinomycetota bacterium]
PNLRAEVERRTGGARVRATFAAAGTGPLTHAQPVYGRGAPRTVGPPVTATTAAIVDPSDPTRVLGSGQPGRLVVHGPQVPDGVHGGGDDPRLHEGWAVTDQLGVVDDDGWLTPLGPLDEVERTAGRWLAPSRVEAVLEDHPAVRRAGVVLTDDGQVHAAVVCRRRPRPDLAELTAHLEEQLDPGTVPDRVHQVDELPTTEAGALARDELRATLAGR